MAQVNVGGWHIAAEDARKVLRVGARLGHGLGVCLLERHEEVVEAGVERRNLAQVGGGEGDILRKLARDRLGGGCAAKKPCARSCAAGEVGARLVIHNALVAVNVGLHN